MARTGLYQSEVKKARDALIAQGRHPSVDAVRVELGNTGSKTTIHKYLKELEELDGGAGGRKASITDALQDLVAGLAAQLHDEGNARIAEVETRSLEKDRSHAEALAALRKDIEAMAGERGRAEAAAHQELAAHERTRAAMQAETIGRRTAEQQVADLKERLAENGRHLQSLEEKHQHARDALEHFRASAKEQRDQDQRRHEHQLQQAQAETRQLQQSVVVKQEELTRLNQDGVRLIADLSHAHKALFDQQSQNRQMALQYAALQEEAKAMATHLAGKEALATALEAQVAAACVRSDGLAARIRELDVMFATAQATLASRQEFSDEVRAFLDARGQAGGSTSEHSSGQT